MTFTLILSVFIIVAAVVAVARKVDVRLALFVAAILLGLLAGKLSLVFQAFLSTFSNEKFVVPICAAMGFAYVLKHTGCDLQLVRLLLRPIQQVRFLLIPGVIVVGFIVNFPVISQTSTAVCLGTVVVPVMRAAGFSMVTIGAALLLGTSVGGELLNPAAPELATIANRTGIPTTEISQQYIPPLVFPLLLVSTLAFWVLHRQDQPSNDMPMSTNDPETPQERFRPDKAMVPLIPLAILFLTSPPLDLLKIPDEWLISQSELAVKPQSVVNSRLIALAMLIGVAAATLSTPNKAKDSMKKFFEGAGYGFTNIISLIVIAQAFGAGIKAVGIADLLGQLINAQPQLLQPLAGFVPALFAFICGSGMASTQTLYGLFHDPAIALQQNPNEVGAMVGTGAAVGRTMSPVAAVTLMCATLTQTNPMDLVRRVAPPLLIGLISIIILRYLGWI